MKAPLPEISRINSKGGGSNLPVKLYIYIYTYIYISSGSGREAHDLVDIPEEVGVGPEGQEHRREVGHHVLLQPRPLHLTEWSVEC